ncbi:MAG TPA: hypothetical protein PLM24_05630 [Methanothrix sp.]|nr:hypothetical protein [Methanothrix sp.]
MPNRFRLGILTVAIILFAVSVTEAYDVDTSYNSGIGIYMVDEGGRTLYYFDEDNPKESNVDDGEWSPFDAGDLDDIRLPSDLNRRDFDRISRGSGKFQTTYRGWPLYLYLNRGPGDISGDDRYVDGGLMHVAYPTMEQCK